MLVNIEFYDLIYNAPEQNKSRLKGRLIRLQLNGLVHICIQAKLHLRVTDLPNRFCSSPTPLHTFVRYPLLHVRSLLLPRFLQPLPLTYRPLSPYLYDLIGLDLMSDLTLKCGVATSVT